MGKSEETKDLVEKEFLAFPDIAADVINVLLYQGKEETKASFSWTVEEMKNYEKPCLTRVAGNSST